ncbi:MAG: zinc metalloprotease HtpX [Candidatus Omnitrophica bacterium]|nr:zinc metalloprotease HtpX [Candidatus Omnitrophota bacterium]
MWFLKIKMYLLLAILFAIVYAVVSMISYSLGVTNFYFYLILSIVMMFIQYMLGPKVVEWMMQVRYVSEKEYPHLHRMVEELAWKAGIPKPRIGVSYVSIPNAFAFGRSIRDGRVCVTTRIIQLLSEEELKAVLGHEISHIRNRDMLTITLLSVIPMLLYRLSWHLLWFGSGRRREERGPSVALIGMVAFLFYFITNLLVLYASRIREYFADRGSIILGNKASALATALYKLVYGSARTERQEFRNIEGLKAFFLNDPSRALNEIRELRQIDLDKSGTIDPYELESLQNRPVRLDFADKLLELLSTHPNMVKRIKQLSRYSS